MAVNAPTVEAMVIDGECAKSLMRANGVSGKDRIAAMAKRRLEEVEADEREREGLSELTGDEPAPRRVRVPHMRTGMPDWDVPGDVAEPMQPPRPAEPGQVARR
jgi:hypothetical protein